MHNSVFGKKNWRTVLTYHNGFGYLIGRVWGWLLFVWNFPLIFIDILMRFFCSSAHFMLCLHSFPPYLFWITVVNDYFLIVFMSVFIFEFNMNCKSCCLILMRLLKWIYHDISMQCVRFVLHWAYTTFSKQKNMPRNKSLQNFP